MEKEIKNYNNSTLATQYSLASSQKQVQIKDKAGNHMSFKSGQTKTKKSHEL